MLENNFSLSKKLHDKSLFIQAWEYETWTYQTPTTQSRTIINQ